MSKSDLSSSLFVRLLRYLDNGGESFDGCANSIRQEAKTKGHYYLQITTIVGAGRARTTQLGGRKQTNNRHASPQQHFANALTIIFNCDGVVSRPRPHISEGGRQLREDSISERCSFSPEKNGMLSWDNVRRGPVEVLYTRTRRIVCGGDEDDGRRRDQPPRARTGYALCGEGQSTDGESRRRRMSVLDLRARRVFINSDSAMQYFDGEVVVYMYMQCKQTHIYEP